MSFRPPPRREPVAWLDADLDASRDRPTMVFLHYPLLPVGLSQCEYYTLPMPFQRALIETFARHGQVRHVISGHVHAGIRSSIKCSWTWRGTNYIVGRLQERLQDTHRPVSYTHLTLPTIYSV